MHKSDFGKCGYEDSFEAFFLCADRSDSADVFRISIVPPACSPDSSSTARAVPGGRDTADVERNLATSSSPRRGIFQRRSTILRCKRMSVPLPLISSTPPH